MSLYIAQVVVTVFEIDAMVGLAFALLFLPRAAVRLDHGMEGAPIALRLLILPGVVAFWPLFAWRWIAARSKENAR